MATREWFRAGLVTYCLRSKLDTCYSPHFILQPGIPTPDPALREATEQINAILRDLAGSAPDPNSGLAIIIVPTGDDQGTTQPALSWVTFDADVDSPNRIPG